MNYTPLIRKLLAGEALDALERAELASFDADALIGEKDALARERDQLKTEHLSLKRGQRLREVAKKYNCADPDLGIDWQVPVESACLSDKDKILPRIKECF